MVKWPTLDKIKKKYSPFFLSPRNFSIHSLQPLLPLRHHPVITTTKPFIAA